MAIETITTLDFGVLFNPIFKFILLLLAIFGGYSLIKDLIGSVHCCYKDKLEHNLIEKLTEKDVRIITTENAQEIHEINKKIDEFNDRMKMLEWKYKEVIEDANNNN